MVDRFKRFSFSIFEISRCWHKLAADVMSQYDLKGPYAMYLVVLLDTPEGLTAAQLCELCGRDKADVSRGLSAMLSKGLICRESGNTYRAKIHLTPLGEDVARHVCQRASLAVELAGKNMSEQNRTIFYNSLTSITANLRELSLQGLPENVE